MESSVFAAPHSFKILIIYGCAGSSLLRELSPVLACRLLTEVASLVAEHELLGHSGFSSHGTRAQEFQLTDGHRLSCSAACEIFLDQGLNLCPLHCGVDS